MKTHNVLIKILLIFLVCGLVGCPLLTSPDDDGLYDKMVKIPFGWFVMGSDDGKLNEKPAHDVYLSTYYIDKYEASAKEFADFLNDKGNEAKKYFSHDQYSTIIGVDENGNEVEEGQSPYKYVPREGLSDYPANNVSWEGANEYCTWKDKRLPTEAQWEKAARGDDRRKFPWGIRKPDPARARFGQLWENKKFYVMVPVTALTEGDSPYGVTNMSGNVWEWVNDWYRQNYCNFCEISAFDLPPRDNPEGPLEGSFRVLRGGSWHAGETVEQITATYRYWLKPTERYMNTGVRCAK